MPMLTDKPDDDAYVFWYASPAKDSRGAYSALTAAWIKAGVVPRQGTPVEIARRVEAGAVQVKQHAPPRVPDDVPKVFSDYAEAAIPHVKGQADLYLSGTAVRARIEFEYLGEDELSPPRVDPRRDFIQGVLFLPQYWREKAKGFSDGDQGAAASSIEDALADKYLTALVEQTAPLAMFSGPEHDNIRWRFTEAELRGPLPPRLSELSRFATYLPPDQVHRLGADNVARLGHVFEWIHVQEPRIKPYCKLTSNGGAILARWPGSLDKEPKFAAMLEPKDREALNHVRAALLPPQR